MSLMSLSSPINPIEIASLTFLSIPSFSMFNKKISFLLIFTESLILLKLIVVNPDKIFPKLTRLGSQGLTSSVYNNSIALSDDDKIAFISDFNNGFDVINLKDINALNYPFVSREKTFSKINQILYYNNTLYVRNTSISDRYSIR